MYRRILAAVNEYSNSEVAARYAVSLARVCGAELTLMFVAERAAPASVVRQAEAALARLFLLASGQEVAVASIMQKGDPFRHIEAAVREERIDLVFSATRHEDVSRRYFVRTLARRLMLHLPCSVALVRVVHLGRSQPQHILVPYRGLPARPREKALFVAKLAEACGARVTLFYSPEPLTGLFRSRLPAARTASDPGMARQMEEFAQSLAAYGVTPDMRFGQGPAGRAITVEAAVHRHDLIIMGASERGLWESLVSGDPVEQVLRETPCNLIILLPRLTLA